MSADHREALARILDPMAFAFGGDRERARRWADHVIAEMHSRGLAAVEIKPHGDGMTARLVEEVEFRKVVGL